MAMAVAAAANSPDAPAEKRNTVTTATHPPRSGPARRVGVTISEVLKSNGRHQAPADAWYAVQHAPGSGVRTADLNYVQRK